MEAHADEQAAYETERLRYERDLARWKGSGGGEPPERPEEPQAVRYIVADTTTEALAPVLLANPRGVLLARLRT